ncbi:interferon-inducible GTPase 5-like [Neolamprologus brichardi]|nr:interferon-inducible GTPase 5-like [Neolamprologus brichardi]
MMKEKNITLNIAITGEAGSGKSTFVNALRDLSDGDEGAAPTGVTETTMKVTEYPHPKYPNVTLWDLPGIGTTKFPADEYLKLVGFEKFDFFIIISDTRFRENDVKLAQEIQRMKKKLYFVRSKIDNNMRAERRKRDFSADEALTKIREDCVNNLKKLGVESPQVFLVSSFELRLYDFSLLHETLEEDLPEHQRDALLFATSSISLEIINKKKAAFQSRIKYNAFLSAAAGGVPIPLLPETIDVSMMAAVVTQYVDGFGLDKPSLERLAANTGVPYSDLCDVMKSSLAKQEIDKGQIMKVLTSLAQTAVLQATGEAAKWIPVFGFAAGMSLSFCTTYTALNYFLDTLAEDALKVFERALSGNK